MKVERDERGGAKRGTSGLVEEEARYGQDFSAGSSWSTVQGGLTPRWKNPALANEKTMSATFYVEFYASSLAGDLYVDDPVLSEEP